MRSVAVLLLLTLSVTAVLVMILVRGSVDQRLALLRDTVGTDIQVRPVGSFQGAGEPLIDSEVQSWKPWIMWWLWTGFYRPSTTEMPLSRQSTSHRLRAAVAAVREGYSATVLEARPG